MPEPTTYEIVLRGQVSSRLLRPLLDDFTVDASGGDEAETTRLVGEVVDPAHLHGVLAHLTSVNIEIVAISSIARTKPSMKEDTAMTNSLAQTSSDTALTMQAVIQERYGSADVLEFGTVDRPTPGPNEVLIEVEAAGVDRGTCHVMTGTPYLIRLLGFGLTKPKNRIPGLDVAGRVVAIGANVTRFVPGDDVFGLAKGSLAEYTVALEDKLAVKPTNLSFEQAAVASVSGITALQALTDVGRVEAGQQVLIVGASGGVGSFAVQLAKAFGAKVTGVAGTRNLDLVRTLGADHVVDHNNQDFTDTVARYDLILDIGGRSSISRLRSVLTPNGTLVFVGGEGGNRLTGGTGRQIAGSILSLFVKHRLTMFVSTESYTFIERLAEHLENGSVVPAIQSRFVLPQAAEAIDQLDNGRSSGKSVIITHEVDRDA